MAPTSSAHVVSASGGVSEGHSSLAAPSEEAYAMTKMFECLRGNRLSGYGVGEPEGKNAAIPPRIRKKIVKTVKELHGAFYALRDPGLHVRVGNVCRLIYDFARVNRWRAFRWTAS